MIKTFADKRTRDFYEGRFVKQFEPFKAQAVRRMILLDEAPTVEHLAFIPSNRLEALRGKRQGQWSIRINQQWRVCFRFEDGDAYDVEITDYHR